MPQKKYLFKDGVMIPNPDYKAEQTDQKPSMPMPNASSALTVVSTMSDVAQATEAQQVATGKPMQLSEQTVKSMEAVQDQKFIDKFKTSQPLDGGDILDGISKYFARYEVPIGLLNKVLALTEYNLNFYVDDSGSMGGPSDVLLADATDHIKARHPGLSPTDRVSKLTRWEEAADRIHILIDMLSYIPSNPITISFLNEKSTLTLKREGETPEQFQVRAHKLVNQLFSRTPMGMTPLYTKMSEAFRNTRSNTMHYIFTDGEPSDAPIDEMKDLVLKRSNPKMNPINFMSCTDDGRQAQWMKDIEEDAPFTSEIDDYYSEHEEVISKQGKTFPFTRGFWLLCQLCAPINPDDLDALDEKDPFSKMTLDNLLGRKLTKEEYHKYFVNHPGSSQYARIEDQFAREDITAKQILNKSLSSGLFSWGSHSSSRDQKDQQNSSLFSFGR